MENGRENEKIFKKNFNKKFMTTNNIRVIDLEEQKEPTGNESLYITTENTDKRLTLNTLKNFVGDNFYKKNENFSNANNIEEIQKNLNIYDKNKLEKKLKTILAAQNTLINPWIIRGLEVTEWRVSEGEAIVECTRSNEEKIMVHFQNTSVLNIDTSGNKKIFIKIDDHSIENETYTGNIFSNEILPNKNTLLIATIVNGKIQQEGKIFWKNLLRKNISPDGVLVIENGEEKIKTSLPENITNNIKIETEKQIVKYSGEIFEGIIRETIPDVLTPVTYIEWGEIYEEIGSVSYSQPIRIKRDYNFTIMEIAYTGTGSENKIYDLTPYSDDGQAFPTKTYQYPNLRNLNISTKEFKVNFRNSDFWDSFKVIIKYNRPAGFYKFAHNNVYGRLVGFLRNKPIGERIIIEDIARKYRIDFEQADGLYWINKDGNITKSNNTSPQLKLGEVKNRKLTLNLHNFWDCRAKTYVHFGLSIWRWAETIQTGSVQTFTIPRYKIIRNEVSDGNFI